MTLTLRLKRFVRRLIPNFVMAWLRIREHSRQVRSNVDVIVDAPLMRVRWLISTPDTYRVRRRQSGGAGRRPTFVRLTPDLAVGYDGTPDRDVLVIVDEHADDGVIDSLLQPLTDPWLSATVFGRALPPGLAGRRRSEPGIHVSGLAVRSEAWSEVGGAPGPPGSLVGLLDRVRDAGHAYALVPDADSGARWRTDVVSGPLCAVVFALVPMHDVGGGSRGSQLAQEFLARGHHVLYVAMYGTAESIDLGLRFIHPGLEQCRVHEFDPQRFADRVEGRVIVIVEAPTAEYADMAVALGDRGATIVYDLIDDWTASSLGGEWFRPEHEERVVAASDALTASAPALVVGLEQRSRRPVAYVPNAVNPRLFGGDVGPRPRDLPTPIGPLIGYHGSLYGDWFDWASVARLAESRPDAAVILIGDRPQSHPTMPANVSFLGLKPQKDLLAYVGRFDLGIIPFEVSDVTHAVSPLKAFEYLAAGVPVAASPLDPLRELTGVYVDDDLNAAVDRALAAEPPNRHGALHDHAWSERVERLLRAAGLGVLPIEGAFPPLIVERPVTHWTRSQRRI